MEYKSPIPLLRYANVDIGSVSNDALLKAQKRLLVELDLSGTNSLAIGQQSFTKDDILTLIESARETQFIRFHEWIHENPSLLKLISDGRADDSRILFSGKLRANPAFDSFRSFISPFLAQPLGKAIHQAFLKREFVKVDKLLQGADLIISAYYDETFTKLKHAIQALASEIKQMQTDASRFNPSHFDFVDTSFIRVLNNLPDDFEPLREQVVVALVNLAVTHGKKYQAFFANIHETLLLVKCRPATYQVIESNVKVAKQNAERGTQQSSGPSPFRIIFFILLILSFIMRTCH